MSSPREDQNCTYVAIPNGVAKLSPTEVSSRAEGVTSVNCHRSPERSQLVKRKTADLTADLEQLLSDSAHLTHDQRLEQLEFEDTCLTDRVETLNVQLITAEERVQRLKAEIKEVHGHKMKIQFQIKKCQTAENSLWKYTASESGPLPFIESAWFQSICMLVVVVNVMWMVNQSLAKTKFAKQRQNPGFLIFYWVELLMGIIHHQHSFFLGRCQDIWWHWLDFIIVLSGTIELCVPGGIYGMSFLRLLRLLRLVKVLKVLNRVDLHWVTSSAYYETVTTSVICINAVTMGLELDYSWSGWKILNNIYLVFYAIDLAIRLKFWGRDFFLHPTNLFWNYMDSIIVFAGMLDLWLLPVIELVHSEVYGQESTLNLGKLKYVMQVIRLMRLLRILRLMQLVRRVKPLYKLMRGISDAVDAMKWVLVVTVILIYALSIVFTYLVGQGLIYTDGAPQNAVTHFGTVSRSMFSLFELMNGDIAVAASLLETPVGKFMFIGFMVIANWSILAILTSVVSDGMISTTNKIQEEECKKASDIVSEEHREILEGMFVPRDPDETGLISEAVWQDMLSDRIILEELKQCSSLSKEELLDLFECLAVEEDHHGATLEETMVNYHELIKNLHTNEQPADKRSVCHVMLRMQLMQNDLSKQISDNRAAMNDRFAALENRADGSPSAPEATKANGPGSR